MAPVREIQIRYRDDHNLSDAFAVTGVTIMILLQHFNSSRS
jgi:hypothetical protein